jgi:uncharacterized protein (UPF0264 family)
MSGLLVSVRSVEEAIDALKGGADLIDIKEPSLGSLGRAADDVLLTVADAVAEARPMSAALGEMSTIEPLPPRSFLGRARFVKCGLAGSATQDWRTALHRIYSILADVAPNCRLAVAAYADWRRAESPPLEDVCSFAIQHKLGGLLIDTWRKDGKHLLDWLPLTELAKVCHRCREAAVEIALAGSLNHDKINLLKPLQPDWFAVRGAACRTGNRSDVVDQERVRTLKALLTD